MRELKQALPEADAREIAEAFRELRGEYEAEGRSFQVVEIEGGYQVLTRPEYFPWVRRLRSDIRSMRLSRAAVETLAIIAYRQPVPRSEIEHIRGVDAGGVLRTLLDKNLITLRGRAEGVGRPLLYGTTEFFLNHFGLKDLMELPKLEELSEIMRSQEMAEIEAEADRTLGPREPAGEPGPEMPGDEGSDTRGEDVPPHEDEESSDVAAAGDF
jgi:segregation and condensation protein B